MKDLQKRLLNNSHLVLTLIAIVLILLVLATKESLLDSTSWDSILLNVATELIGVVIVFFLLNKLLLGDEMRLSERVEAFLNKLESQNQAPSATKYFLNNPSMRSLFQNSHRVDMLGVTLSSAIGDKFGEIRQGLRQGCHYRIILAHPDSAGFETAVVRSQIQDKQFYKTRINNTIKALETLSNDAEKEKAAGKIEVRLLEFATSFGIKIFDSDQKHGRIFVEIYPYQTDPTPFIELQPTRDGEWFPYFVSQFDSFWNIATSFDGKIIT